MSIVNGKPYYYSFDLSCVPSLYDFIQNDNGAKDAGCKCYDACVKCKVVEVTNNKDDWVDSTSAFWLHSNNERTKNYNHSYFLVNYDKKILQKRVDDGVEYGYEQYVRSVILNSDRKIVCFSPPMCEHMPRSKDDSGIKNALEFSKVKFAEEFVEGTMVNLFYNPSNDVQGWEFSTRNVVSPAEKKENGSGVVDKKCFRRMFFEACAVVGLNFDDLPKEYSYSFVLQHPDNTIVAPVKNMALYIVAMYHIDGTTVYEMDRSVVKWSAFSSVRHPARFGLKNEEDFRKILNVWASSNSLYYYPGVMFRTHDGARYKFRNPNYEFVKNARGVDEKSRFIYLHLKKVGKLQSHFDRFPENQLEFFQYQKNFYNYTHNLHQNYLECCVHKKKPLKEYAVEYKKNIFLLHQHYKTVLKMGGKRVDMAVVIEFMNEQSLSSQLFVLKKFEDSVKIAVKVISDNGEVYTPPIQESDEIDCPGAPLKKSK
jgi:hypothetical protein